VTRPPEYQTDGVRLYRGDAAEVLSEMPAESVNCLVTSPPFWGLRDYRVPGQYGLEPTLDRYVANLRRVFAEARRVLAADGTLWLNLGDCYGGSWHNYVAPGSTAATAADRRRGRRGRHRPPQASQRYKSLQGTPWRVAFALVEDGWILRNAIVWHKPNGRPESARDRLTCRHEMLFLLVRSRRYWFDLDALGAHPTHGPTVACDRSHRCGPGAARDRARASRHETRATCRQPRVRRAVESGHGGGGATGRNPGDVWTIPTGRYRGEHAAVGSIELARRAVAAGCMPGGVVCDPFSGTATTGLAALTLGCQYVGIELSPASNAEAIQRLRRHQNETGRLGPDSGEER